MPIQTIDAVKTASNIHKGDFSTLRGKSFVIRGNIKKKRRGKHVKKPRPKYTLDQIGGALFEFIKTTNTRLDNLTDDVKSLKQDVKTINTRLDYIVKANNLKDVSDHK